MAKHHHTFPQTVTALAAQLGVDRTHLSSILSARSGASVSLAKRIQTATGGAILWTEFFQDPPDHRDPTGEDELGKSKAS